MDEARRMKSPVSAGYKSFFIGNVLIGKKFLGQMYGKGKKIIFTFANPKRPFVDQNDRQVPRSYSIRSCQLASVKCQLSSVTGLLAQLV